MNEEVLAALEELKTVSVEQLAALKKRINDLETKAARPGMPGAPKAGAADSPDVERLARYVRTGEVDRETKAMSIGSAPNGGVTVPDELDTQITQLSASFSPLRRLARVVKAGSAEWTAVVATSEAGAEWRAETDAVNETDTPGLALVKPPSGELSAMPKLTTWLLNDSSYNLAQFVLEYVARAFGIAEGAAFWSGTGTNQPKGLTAYDLVATGDATRDFGKIEKLHSGSSGAFDADDLFALFFKLNPAYRANASWLVSAQTLATIRTLKDATTGQYLWQPGLMDGQPDRLLGRPIYEDPNVPAIAADAAAIWVGDFKAGYVVTDIGQVVMVRDEVTSKGNVLLWTAKRVGGALLDSSAVKALVLT